VFGECRNEYTRAKAPTDTAANEIAGLIAEAPHTPGLTAEVAAILSGVLADVPPEIRDHWGAGEATMSACVEPLVAKATDCSTARMHGTAGV
jgi:hypothetical protein